MCTPTLLALWARMAGAGRRGRGAMGLALVLTLSGCPEAPPPEPDPGMRLEVGTGQEQFTAFVEGEPLWVQKGCQGGQHVFVSLRGWGLPSYALMVELALTRPEDEQKVSSKFRVRYLFAQGSGEDAPDELPGLLLQLPDPSATVGRAVRLSASVELDSGQRVSDEYTGTLQWGPPACP